MLKYCATRTDVVTLAGILNRLSALPLLMLFSKASHRHMNDSMAIANENIHGREQMDSINSKLCVDSGSINGSAGWTEALTSSSAMNWLRATPAAASWGAPSPSSPLNFATLRLLASPFGASAVSPAGGPQEET